MAFSAITTRGSLTEKVSDTTIAISPSANLTVGKVVIVQCATDNDSTAVSDGSSTRHSLADSQGNTWVKIAEYTDADGTAASGVTISLWRTVITSQISTANTITLTCSSAVTNKIISLFEATVGTKSTIAVEAVGVGQSAISASVASMTSREYLLVGFGGSEGNDNAKTPDTDYTERFDLRTGSGTAATEICTHVVTRIATLTADTCTSSAWTNTNPIFLLAAIYEVPNTAPTISPNSPADAASISDSTPTLEATATDAQSDDVRYQFQIATDNLFSNGDIVKGTVGSNRTSGGDPTVSVNITTQNAIIAIVTTQDSNTANLGAATVVRNGQSFTMIGEYGGSGGTGQPVRIQIWQLVNPTAGTYDVVADCNGSINECAMVCYPLDNADTADLVNGYNGSSSSGASPSVSVTTDADNCYLIGGLVSEGTITAVGGGQDSDASLTDQSFENTRATSKQGTTAGSQSLSFTSNSAAYAIMMVAINKAAGGGSIVLDKVSGTDSGFANTVNGGDTDPFTSGEKVGFTVQAGDALADDTYYWRARAIDPNGINTWSSWTTTRSFDLSSSTSVTATPGHVALAGAIQAPTITAQRHVSTTADQLAATASLPASSVQIASLANPSVISATGAIQPPTVTAIRNATASPGQVSATAALQSASATAIRNVLTAVSVIDALTSIQSPTIRIPLTVVADLLQATGAVQSPTISTTRSVTVSPSEVTATLSIQVPVATGIQNTTISPAVLALISAIQAPTVDTTRSVSISPDVVNGNGSLQDPGIETSGNVDVAAATEVLLGLLEDPTVTAIRNVTVQVGTVQLTADIEGPVITGIRNVTSAPDPLTATTQLSNPSLSTGATITTDHIEASVTIEEPDVEAGVTHINVTIQASAITLVGILQDVSVKVQRRKALYSAGGNLYHRKPDSLATESGFNYQGRGELYKNVAPQG